MSRGLIGKNDVVWFFVVRQQVELVNIGKIGGFKEVVGEDQREEEYSKFFFEGEVKFLKSIIILDIEENYDICYDFGNFSI